MGLVTQDELAAPDSFQQFIKTLSPLQLKTLQTIQDANKMKATGSSPDSVDTIVADFEPQPICSPDSVIETKKGSGKEKAPAKRGRGRPRKQSSVSTDQVEEKVKRPRGRPPKSKNDGIQDISPTVGDKRMREKGQTTNNAAPTLMQTRTRPKKSSKNNIDDEIHSSSLSEEDGYQEGNNPVKFPPLDIYTTRKANYSDRFYVPSRAQVMKSPFCNLYKDKDIDFRVWPVSGKKRATIYTRQSNSICEKNKLLIAEIRKSCEQKNTFTPLEWYCYHALSSYLPVVETLSYVDNDMLCVCCARRKCNVTCPLRSTMAKAITLFTWMKTVKWKSSFVIGDLITNIDINSKSIAVKKWMASSPDSSPVPVLTPYMALENDIVSTINKCQQELWKTMKVLHGKEHLHLPPIHRAMTLFLTFDWTAFNSSDILLVMKICRLLVIPSCQEELTLDYWNLISTDEPIIPLNANPQHQEIARFSRDLFLSFGHKYGFTIAETSGYSHEQEQDDWGVNFSFIENGTSSPEVNSNACAVYCSFPYFAPICVEKIALAILHPLRLDIINLVPSNNDTGKEMITAFAKNEMVGSNISCTVDNWQGNQHIHVYLSIDSPDLENVVKKVKRSLKTTLKLTDCEKAISVLPFSSVELEHNDLSFSTTSGFQSYSPEFGSTLQYPTTHIKVSQGKEIVAQCYLTFSHNKETYMHGPSIQSIAVKKNHRDKSIGRRLLGFIESCFLKFWNPGALSLSLFATYVCSAHSFFRNNGYHFFDSFQEEANKLVIRR